MELYEFAYTDCIFEAPMWTISVHTTKKGAYKAMRTFLEKEYNQWRETGLRYGKQYYNFGTHCEWKIRTITVQD